MDQDQKFDTPLLQPVKKWYFFPGDTVVIKVGPDEGKLGHVKKVIQERNWVIVEGLHCKYLTVGKTSDNPGTTMKLEMPLSIHNEVALVDPEDSKATKIVWRYDELGNQVRVSTRTGRIIKFPAKMEETVDYKSKKLTKDNE